MKHAELLTGPEKQRATGEVILVMPQKEFRQIADAVELAAKAHPRKTSLKTLLKKLELVDAW